MRCTTSLRRSLLLLALSALAVLGMAGCGGEPAAAAAAPSTFCKETDKPVCKGNYVATCTNAGTAYKLQFCGPSNRCDGGECKPVVCPRGQLTCSGKDVMMCPEDGATEPAKVKTCASTTTCQSGACIAKTCKKDEIVCAWGAAWTCENGVPTENSCPGNQQCVATKGCTAAVCTPTEARCKDPATAQTCGADGMAWTDKVCPTGEACYDGVCHTKLAVKADKDSSSSDAAVGVSDTGVSIGTGDTVVGPKKDIQVTQPDEFQVTFSKTKTPGAEDAPLKFDFPQASFSQFTQILTISGDKDLFKVEIQLAKLEEYATGTFSQVGGEAPDTALMVNDGSNDQTQVQWLWMSTDYDMELTEFGDVGTGRIVGTFSAELINTVDKKTKAWLVDGKFDILRN